uniref:Transposase (putative) gypsy type domain-containing protein n=1 Tax=Tanacetum cinerariifolium TaxID=118510 RepID=A0A6L2NMP6_TANCI|nr:hypothetical protein [Tanacetum cinerariifolium]
MMRKCCFWGLPELGTQAGVLALEKHDNCEGSEGKEGEIFLFLNPDGNIIPYASHDTIQLETAVSTISQEYLLEFTSEYGISEDLHPELPGLEERIVDFSEGKVGVYTKFFEFANFRLPLSQFLFDILGHYQIHLSKLSIIGAAKVSHFKINCHVLNIVPTLNLFRVFYIPSFNSGWMSFNKRPGKNTLQCHTKPLDSLKNWNNRFFWVDERVFPTVAEWRVSALKDEMPAEDTYSSEAVAVLNTHHTPIQKQPEALLCLVGLSQRYFLGDDVYPTFLHDDDRDMDLFNLICAPNPTNVKIGTHPRAAHEVPLLSVTASRVIEMEDPAETIDSFEIPSTIERSPLDFANENPSQQSTGGDGMEDQGQETVAPEVTPPENVTTMRVAPETGLVEEIAAMGPRVIKKRHKRRNDGVDTNAPPKVLRKDHVDSRPTQITIGGKSLASMGLETRSTFPVPTPRETPADVSDPNPLSFANPSSKGAAVAGDPESENTSFTSMARENEIKNLEALLEAETDMKKAAEAKNAELVKELENLRALFADLQLSNDRLSQQRCAEMDARLDTLSIDFDEELYPHMLIAITGRRWVIRHGLHLAVMKCGESTELRQVFADVVSTRIAKGMSEGLKYGVEHEKDNLDLGAIEAYDPKANTKYVTALHAIRDLKYPMVDQLETSKDAPIDVIMASLHLKSDSGKDAP